MELPEKKKLSGVAEKLLLFIILTVGCFVLAALFFPTAPMWVLAAAVMSA